MTITFDYKSTHHPGILVAGLAVTEGRREGGAARLVVARRLAVIGDRVDGDGPHGARVAVTVAVVVRPTVPRCPDIDAASAVSALHTQCNAPKIHSRVNFTHPHDHIVTVSTIINST